MLLARPTFLSAWTSRSSNLRSPPRPNSPHCNLAVFSLPQERLCNYPTPITWNKSVPPTCGPLFATALLGRSQYFPPLSFDCEIFRLAILFIFFDPPLRISAPFSQHYQFSNPTLPLPPRSCDPKMTGCFSPSLDHPHLI